MITSIVKHTSHLLSHGTCPCTLPSIVKQNVSFEAPQDHECIYLPSPSPSIVKHITYPSSHFPPMHRSLMHTDSHAIISDASESYRPTASTCQVPHGNEV
ncbi:hypothetical protein BC936DRAFT_136787 [Jimgerdemannia flammicorona]|uniref:Uncharacterized protein n=1 Tax=Jimgerdemannia flammicorona TaxID=994334 RepID=A0A433CYT8_9FUNG|nr:hypothetical protein BC936DRAFT_136787 [Jimgerdemannia flammicorona]